MRKLLLLALLLHGCGGTAETFSTPAEVPPAVTLPRFDDPDLVARDVNQAAWNQFLYLNWPSKTDERGEPDPSKQLGDPGPRAWETMKSEDELFRADGSDPGDWDTPEPLPPDFKLIDNDNPNFLDPLTPKLLVDLHGNPIQYEVRINRPVFETVRALGLYSLKGQLAYFNDVSSPPLNFPFGSFECKAAWTILDADDPPTYHTALAVVNVGTQAKPVLEERTVGLTGMHVLTKPTGYPNWFWCTFVHRDNAARTPTITEHFQVTPTPEVARKNEEMHALLKGTVWENYDLVGVQLAYVDAAGNPTLLANNQIETAFASTSSCITCHQLAQMGPGTDTPSRPEFFRGQNNQGNPIGFVGPPAEPQLPDLRSLDFVYSLTRAH